MLKQLVCFLLLGVFLCSGCGDEFTKPVEPSYPYPPEDNEFLYEIEENGEVTVTNIPNVEEFIIPENITYNEEKFIVTFIGENAVANKDNLKTLYLPPTLKRIDKKAFAYTSLENLFIEDLSSWCNIDFEYETYNGHHNRYDYSSSACPISPFTNLYINNQLIETLIIPDDVFEIPAFAFNNLNCKKVIIGKNVRNIDIKAFYQSSLEDLDLGDNTESIWQEAFASCENLKTIRLSPTLSVVAYGSFYGADNISKVYSPNEYVPFYINQYLSLYDYFAQPAFGYSYDFYINNGLPENIVVPFSEKELGDYIFAGAKNVRSVVYEEGLKTTGFLAFCYCENLESVTLPSTLETIGTHFTGCRNLKKLEIRSQIPPERAQGYGSALEIDDYNYMHTTLYVPEESIQLYKESIYWGQFKNILPIDE